MDIKRGKVIIVAAPSGSGRKNHLRRVVEYCLKNGKKIKVYQIGQMLFDEAVEQGIHLTRINVLDRNPDMLSGLRAIVFEKILGRLDKERLEYDAIIISLHHWFFWRKIPRIAYNYSYLEKFQPDLFVTFITSGAKILHELNSRDQWKNQNLTLEDVLYWQSVEVETTRGFSQLYKCKFFAIPTDQPPHTFYKLMFCPEFEPLYPSFPITRLKKKKSWNRVMNLIKWLDTRFTVINHLYIQTGAIQIHNKVAPDLAEHYQTVFRDLYWLLGPCLHIVAFFPEIVASWGVLAEVNEAVQTTKNTWVIYPGELAGPFERYLSGRIFKDEDEFKEFIDKEHFKGNPPRITFID